MVNLHWELSIISRAVHFPTLTSAAQNIGMSQPQLSRIVKRVEDELSIVILDRTAKRKSGWMSVAFELAQLYSTNERKLELDIIHLQQDRMLTHLRIGTLEGLSLVASEFCQRLFKNAGVLIIELDIYEIEKLEEEFQQGNLDLMFGFREPGKKKYKYSLNIGSQEIKKITQGGTWAVSHYEYEKNQLGRKRKKDERILICNSLNFRKNWIEANKASGWVPSAVYKAKNRHEINEHHVLLIGSDLLSPVEWKTLTELVL